MYHWLPHVYRAGDNKIRQVRAFFVVPSQRAFDGCECIKTFTLTENVRVITTVLVNNENMLGNVRRHTRARDIAYITTRMKTSIIVLITI